MSEQAEKTEEQKAAEAEAARKAAEEEAEDGFEVVTGEEGETPSSNSVPLSSFLKQKEKWKRRAENANQNAEGLKAENELLRLQLEQVSSQQQKKTIPKAEDFDDPEEHSKALDKYISETSEQTVKKLLQSQQTNASEPDGNRTEANEEALRQHYERAAKLKAEDFDDAENEVITVLGQEAARQIIEQFDNSEAVMYALGKNPGRLADVAAKLRSDPVKGVIEITKFASGLQLKPRKKAPDPDNVDKGTGGGSDLQRQLDKLRARYREGKVEMKEVIAFKRDAKSQGVTLI